MLKIHAKYLFRFHFSLKKIFMRRVLFSLKSFLFTNTFTTMHVKNKKEHETGSHHCWLSDRPLHMTDVKLFTHAFSANVSTESAHFKHDGLITPRNFYRYHTRDMYGAAGQIGEAKITTTEKHHLRLLHIIIH